MAQQFQYVVSMFFSAWLMGAVFDVYNTVTSASAWLRWLRPLADLVFWLASAAFVYYWMYVTDDGRFRLYALLLLAAGYAAYRVILHRAVVASAFAIVRFVGGCLRLGWRVIQGLVIRPLWLVWRLVAWLVGLTYRCMCRLEDLVFFIIRMLLRPLRWVLAPPLRRSEKFRTALAGRWEGIWMRASNWLRKKPVS